MNAVLANLLPHNVFMAEAAACTDIGMLLEQEKLAFCGAIEERRSEFIGGRVAARRALMRLGVAPLPIPVGLAGEPIWPPGIVGSISHAGHRCVAIVALEQNYPSLGIDLEGSRPISSRLWNVICTSSEMETLLTYGRGERGCFAKRIFSIKEAVFKWQYPLTRKYIWWKDLQVELTEPIARFQARFTRRDIPRIQDKCVEGISIARRGTVISVAVTETER
jgi:4'-phosphopantetheinyl transferase EntD